MRFAILSIFIIFSSCNSSKKKVDSSNNSSSEIQKNKEVITNEIEKEELLLVLSNTTNVKDAQNLVVNSGLTWDGMLENTEVLKIAKIKVPANKKSFWLERLQTAGEFKKVTENKPELAKKMRIEASYFLKLEKTACFGDCPTFELHITEDGHVTFNGKNHVAKKGESKFQLSEEELKELKDLINKKEFSSFKNKYDNPKITDLPSTFIYHKGKQVQIRVWKEAPIELITIHEFLDGILLEKKLYE